MITTKATRLDTCNEREEKNRQLAYEAAAEGIVLLENNGVLPLSPCPVALFGAGADYTIKGGSGSGEVNVRHTVTVREGLEQAGFTITSHDWIERYAKTWQSGKDAFIRANRKKLLQFSTKVLADLMAAEYRYPSGDRLTEADRRDADTCIYVLSRQSGEGHDRKDEAGSFRLDITEVSNIRFCADNYPTFILIINTGAPIDLSSLDTIAGIDAIVYMGQLGMEGGHALVDVLTGKQTPSGKLSVTWPKSYDDVPFGNEFSIPNEAHARYREGIYVGYRYYDSFQVEPRYPFGFGRSYTSFECESPEAVLSGDTVQCSITVTNTGSSEGKETVQLYVTCPQEGLYKEYQRLAAFAKTASLKPGESETVHLSFPLARLASYDESASETVLEAGDYILRIGTSSRDTSAFALLRLKERIVVSKHRSLCAPSSPVSELNVHPVCTESHEDLPVLTVDPAVIKTTIFSYEAEPENFDARIDQYLDSFLPEDLTAFCAGTGLFGEKAGFKVPGAVGHTTTAYIAQGIPNIELCDGPAGLRLQRRSTLTKKGELKAVDAAISLYEFLPKFITRFLLGNPEKDPVLYQFVTGFPVAAMIAQSWNTDLAYRIGKAVSAEMSEYGARVWLAPALNIVRNPLCGRNYEYYSEDPLISGSLAAAITKGVQETPGNAVTVKHFAVNNQEENRYYVSSDLDERALREIYLAGFEQVVKEAHPLALMTAYNKVNDTYCANSKDLCTDILRREWGFDGLVMTDWLSTGEDRADESKAIEAGVDLIMPGGKKVVQKLQEGVKESRLTGSALHDACGRVLRLIFSDQQSV